MVFKGDLHIHTALSPCGDNDMTPNNIINMSIIKGLDIIAITDHNSCGNARACMETAVGKDIIVIPGMEVQTREDIHALCLFKDINYAEEFEKYVYLKLPDIKNKAELFGEQLLLDLNDKIIGNIDRMLLASADISFDDAFYAVNELDGVFIPAHIDREGFSLILNLGFIPKYLNIKTVEYFSIDKINELIKKGIINGSYNFIKSSDAHYLYQIMEREEAFEIKIGVNFSISNVIEYLKS